MKRAMPYLAAALFIIAAGLHYLPIEATSRGPIDFVVGVYESENQPVAEVSVLEGSTANAIRKAGKWRQYDKDQIPGAYKPKFDPIIAKQGIPCLILVRGGSVVYSGKLPATNEDLAALIQKQGGY